MKQCPKCHQTYNDNNLNFCLEDGELLTGFTSEPPPARYIDDSPPTMVMNDARVTNPANWPQTPPAAPVGHWQPPQQNLQNQPYRSPGFTPSLDQTLPIISLVLGILSLILICCYGGIWLGLPAAILGFLGMRNAESNPQQYGGRGLAIGGMVLGIFSFLSALAIIIVAIIAR